MASAKKVPNEKKSRERLSLITLCLWPAFWVGVAVAAVVVMVVDSWPAIWRVFSIPGAAGAGRIRAAAMLVCLAHNGNASLAAQEMAIGRAGAFCPTPQAATLRSPKARLLRKYRRAHITLPHHHHCCSLVAFFATATQTLCLVWPSRRLRLHPRRPVTLAYLLALLHLRLHFLLRHFLTC